LEPAIVVALLLAVFAATHIGLAALPVRTALIRRLGRWGFEWTFAVVAAVSFAALVAYYAGHRDEGALGLALGRFPALRALGIAAVVVGMGFVVASLFDYSASPMAVGRDTVRDPRGLQRVTRHGFFVGIALLGAAHALVATRAVGAVLMAGLASFAVVGAVHQDRKLLVLRGEPYAAYLRVTSLVPFAAAIAGRGRIVWRELPWLAFAAGVALAWLLRRMHGTIFDHGGLYVIAAISGGGLVATALAWLRERSRRSGGRGEEWTAPRARSSTESEPLPRHRAS
jgi:uncharacterized membrane protein